MQRPPDQPGLFSADGPSARATRRLAALSDLASALAATLGVAGVVGWLHDIPLLRELVPGLPAIRPLSSLGIGLLGASLWFWHRRPRVSDGLAAGAAALSVVALVPWFAPLERALRLALVDPGLLGNHGAEIASRLVPTTGVAAAGYLALAAAIVLSRRPGVVPVAHALAITVYYVVLIPILGFAFRAESLSSPLTTSAPSLHGAVAIGLLAVALLCKNPERGAVGLLVANTAGSRAARRLLLPALVAPVLVGGLFVYLQRTSTLDLDTALPAFVSALAATLSATVLWTARESARTEILYRRSERALREVADESPLMTWMSDAHGNGTHMNPAMLAFLGLAFQSFRELGRASFVHPEDIPIVESAVQAAMRTRRTFSAEFRARHADGSWRWVLSTGMPRYTPENELSGYTGTWVDVTLRKEAESALQRLADDLEQRVAVRTADLEASREALARQSGLLESVVHSMGDAVLAMSTSGEVLLSNEASHHVFGRAGEAAVNARDPNFGYFRADGTTPYPNEEIPMILALGGVSVDNAIMIVRHSGAPSGIWVRLSARPLKDADGRITGSVVVGRDVTDFEKALEATRRLAAVVEASGDAVLSASLDGRITSWNRGAETMYGLPATEALGMPLAAVDPSLEGDGLATVVGGLRAGALVIRRESSGRRRDGSLVDVAATLSPIHDEDGRVTALSVVHHDVTRLKAVERRIQALNEELASRVRDIEMLNAQLEERVRERTAALLAANSDLENYASSVAHDLRTPLRAIAGFARVLEEDYSGALDDEGRRLVGVVRKNAQDMGAFIDALLSFSAVDRQPPRKGDVDVAAVVRECVDALGADCGERDVVFRVGNLPRCHADGAALKQVFLNLLANAAKFTRRRERAVIEVGSSTDADGATVYHVRDNGVGFDMSNTRRLFGVFQRLHKPSDFEGTGLGLASAARIVAAHGGRIWAEAEPDRGATFFFIIEPREGSA